MGIEILTLERFFCKLRGGSQPILAQASDGLLYVVKFEGGLQGPNLMFNESIGSELFRACGLAVADWRMIQVDDRFLDANQACWFETPTGRTRPMPGLCFGSRLVEGPGFLLTELLPGYAYHRIRNQMSFWLAWLVDICASHSDARQVVFKDYSDRSIDAVFIDHGHLFGGASGLEQPNPLASRYLDARAYVELSSSDIRRMQRFPEGLDLSRLWSQVRQIPGEWKTKSALAAFELCLDRLQEPKAWENVLYELIELHRRSQENDQSRRTSRSIQASVLLHP